MWAKRSSSDVHPRGESSITLSSSEQTMAVSVEESATPGPLPGNQLMITVHVHCPAAPQVARLPAQHEVPPAEHVWPGPTRADCWQVPVVIPAEMVHRAGC
ncbi:MAG: hypothetical protein AMXMBFR34_02650 [Myxococcaceae bacterium]